MHYEHSLGKCRDRTHDRRMRSRRTTVLARISSITLLAGTVAAARVAAAEPDPRATRPSVMLGLMQWIAFGGGNVAAQLKTGRLVFEYSHGQALDLSRFEPALTEEEADADVAVRMPWTTGGGVGFQITPNLHVLVEAKVHRYEVRGADRNQELSYTSVTIGPGIFYDLYLWRGLFIQPNLRWWPTVASTYDAERAVLRAPDGGTYQHERHDLLPFANVNLGWTFDRR
jgi:hypothetical protein